MQSQPSPQSHESSRKPTATRMMGWIFLPGYLALLIGIALFEAQNYRHSQHGVRLTAQADATQYAERIAARLNTQFTELQFAAVTLLPPQTGAFIEPDAEKLAAMRQFLAMHPAIYDFNIESADGNTILWSTLPQSKRPITKSADFAPIQEGSNFLLGNARYADRVGAHVISLRLRLTDAAGNTRFFISTPLRLDFLFHHRDEFSGPWQFWVIDQRTQQRVAEWAAGNVHLLPETGLPALSPPITVKVPDYPFRIVAVYSPAYATTVWFEASRVRWGLETGLLVAVLVGFILLWRSQRRQAELRAAYERAAVEDALTGLANRLGFEAKLPELLAARSTLQEVNQNSFGVIAVDIYQFSELNENWGTAIADDVLRQLAKRLQALPDSRMVARIGADSFALICPAISPDRVHETIQCVLAVTDSAFTIGNGPTLNISLSLGCALLPEDTWHSGKLLSLAEDALFTRAERLQGFINQKLDPYGAKSTELLTWALQFIGSRIQAKARDLYTFLDQDADNKAIFAHLSQEEKDKLREHQAQYLLRLLDPHLTAAEHGQIAEHVGQIHMLIGVSARSLIEAVGLYELTFTELLRRVPGRISERHTLTHLIHQRLERDLTLQNTAGLAIQHRVQKKLDRLTEQLKTATRWAHITDALIDSARHWAWVAFAAVYSQTVEGQLVPEAQTAEHAKLHDTMQLFNCDLLQKNSQHPMAQAWLTGQMETVANLRRDIPADLPWVSALEQQGVRSLAALPILDANRHVLAVLVLYGKLPLQFQTPWMHDALNQLQDLFSQATQNLSTPTPAHISLQDRILWRQQLFGGGLRMYMQPIVDLHTGQCTKVEALARLKLDHERIISPGLFLPLLGDQELNRLFIDGLKQALAHLRSLQDQGQTLDLSFNLPPGTLRHPDCRHWIESALQQFAIEPARITFELLENEEIADAAGYQRAIFSLHELGVHLAMDDLGSGYSSLLRLRTLPFDFVKIDQGLIRAAEKSPYRSISIVGSLMRMAQGLELQVVVEGLESDDLLNAALILGADYAQGYALAKPMPAEELLGWLSRYQLPDSSKITDAHARLSLLAAHWMWEQGIQDRQNPTPETAHLQCSMGQFLAAHGLSATEIAHEHQQMHHLAQTEGVHSPNYLRTRKQFYRLFSALKIDEPA